MAIGLLQALSRAVAQPSIANPYSNGLNVSGAGGTGNWGVSYDPTFGTLAANTGFGEAPIYTPSQFSSLLGKLPGNETFGNGPNQASVTANPDTPKSNLPGSQAQYAASFAPSAGSPLVVNTGGGGGSSFLNAPGGQTIQYGLDPKTGYEVPISARGSAPGTSDIWDSIVPAVLGTAALGGAGALAAGAGAAGAGAAGADVASSIADPTLGFISGAGAPGELAGGIDLGAVAPLGAGGAAAGVSMPSLSTIGQASSGGLGGAGSAMPGGGPIAGDASNLTAPSAGSSQSSGGLLDSIGNSISNVVNDPLGALGSAAGSLGQGILNNPLGAIGLLGAGVGALTSKPPSATGGATTSGPYTGPTANLATYSPQFLQTISQLGARPQMGMPMGRPMMTGQMTGPLMQPQVSGGLLGARPTMGIMQRPPLGI
jgi:hypothetical protein